MRGLWRWSIGLAFALSGTICAEGADLQVISVSPAPHIVTATTDAAISVTFDQPVDRSTVIGLDSFWAFGRWSGTVAGTFSFSNGDQTVTLTPDRPFSSGEHVIVILSHDLAATDGSTLRFGGYSWRFWTRSNPASLNFRVLQELAVRSTPGGRTQAYGGFASDLNRDGYLDLTIVNEITADLRVFLNGADGSGLFANFIRPTFPVAQRASPSEPTDFNRDGIVDICVANIDDNTVSILLGVGDGTFAAQQKVVVGSAPRGIAVMDVDGDGDMDIINTNSSSDNLSILLNDGAGVFGAPTFFEGGGSGEWALAAADMNQDGLLDLVIGAINSLQILINTNNGDGTFSLASAQSSGGRSWMLVCGDLNGDGTEDVSVVNSSNNNGAILLGDGAGNLSAAQTYPTDPFALATDLGDMDGDGDLDWVTSSFDIGGPGEWALFLNDGLGNFELAERFPAPQAGSCCLMFDADNDGDLDLALIDELADIVIIMENVGPLRVPAVAVWSGVLAALSLALVGTLLARSHYLKRQSPI